MWGRDANFFRDPVSYPFGSVLRPMLLAIQVRDVSPIIVGMVEQRAISSRPNEIQQAKFNEVLMNAHRPRLAALGTAIFGGDEEVWDAVLLLEVLPLELSDL
ncbi:hypothetical protein [Rhizobium rosettiformans]|uniref:hypothetical protein n=1 Tax=Rhizobium rosettiformans TaxID=1368430 RepID=UPI0019322A00|nr:hypothetical protein [Rhizobium rosettiformans]